MPDGLSEMLGDARWFPEGFDARSGEFRFVHTDRESLGAQVFLDGRWNRADARRTSLAAQSALGWLPSERPRLHFIWHTGFCCSTLLAKAIDRPGKNLSLCEPQILAEVASALHSGALAPQWQQSLPALTFHLLARSFAPGEQVTVKPAPAANRLLGNAAPYTSGFHLVLYSDCRSFLISIAKLGEDGRKYVRRMYLLLAADGRAPVPPAELVSLTDLELAAVLWHLQIAELRRQWPGARAASLNCDDFLARPAQMLGKLDQFFALGIGEACLAEIAAGPLFRRNAKTGEASFDTQRRRAEQVGIERSLGADLDRIVAQSYTLFRSTPPGPPLPNPLM